jgi:hypothetical protein
MSNIKNKTPNPIAHIPPSTIRIEYGGNRSSSSIDRGTSRLTLSMVRRVEPSKPLLPRDGPLLTGLAIGGIFFPDDMLSFLADELTGIFSPCKNNFYDI